MERLSKPAYYIQMAQLVARRASCRRRQVGCVLVNENGHVLSTGYNGPARGVPNCTEHPCPGATYSSGEGLDLCEAIHAEQNALLQCHDVNLIDTCYVTTEPCAHCAKLLLNTGCQWVIYDEPYPQGGGQNQWVRGRLSTRWLKFSDIT
jgi:dCMP deaminase